MPKRPEPPQATKGTPKVSCMSWSDVKKTPLNSVRTMMHALEAHANESMYAYTLHEIFYKNGVFDQTRSSPNWLGDIVTMATCKHQMRCWMPREDWIGKWNAGFCPSHCANNAMMFVGRVAQAFPSNYTFGAWMKRTYPAAYRAKLADHNPHGDIYTPRRLLTGEERYDPDNFHEPPNHTRSVETYKDGTPKWWKDIRYTLHNRRPPVFLFDPVFLFSEPMVWFHAKLGRAVHKMTVKEFLQGLRRAA